MRLVEGIGSAVLFLCVGCAFVRLKSHQYG